MYIQKEYGDTKVLKNVGILPQHHTVSHPRRPQLEGSLKLQGVQILKSIKKL